MIPRYCKKSECSFLERPWTSYTRQRRSAATDYCHPSPSEVFDSFCLRRGFGHDRGSTLQGVLFGVVLRASEAQSQPKSPQFFLAALLLVLALLLCVKALCTAMGADDEGALSPQWIVKATSMSPLTAFGVGAGFMALSVKFLVFTLGAISAIADAHLGVELAVITFVLFVALASRSGIGVPSRPGLEKFSVTNSAPFHLQRRCRQGFGGSAAGRF